jgi:Tol biopolymer transport system component
MLVSGCNAQDSETIKWTPDQPLRSSPTPLPQGILISKIPPEADIIISSVRYALDHPACLNKDFQLKERFIQDPDCNRVIYNQDSGLAIPRQLFTLDIETGSATQITNTDCFFVSGQAVDLSNLMVHGICEDSNSDGKINEQNNPNLYLLHLPSGEKDCLTCELGLKAINNPDYSSVTEKIIISAQVDPVFHNYLFTIDLNKHLGQITNDGDYMDFDCSWPEDGNFIVFNRLPSPWLKLPAQIWLMNSDGSNLRKITSGEENPQGEGTHRRYPIGTDADADLSPDNSQIVFSRLKTGSENVPIGVWELVVVDVSTGVETVLDSTYANMVPEWKSGGIVFTRQIGGNEPMQIKQGLYLFQEGTFTALESFPYDVFPLGAFGGNWIDLE